MTVFKNKPTRVLIIIMVTLVILGILIARSYYGNINDSIDPRVKEARELYTRYDSYAEQGNYFKVLSLLDSIETTYKAVDHYKDSYEVGVIYNNRAATFLTIALFSDSIPSDFNPYSGSDSYSLIRLAEESTLHAISIYQNWDSIFSDKTKEQIYNLIKPGFLIGFNKLEPDLEKKYLLARVHEIEESIKVNNRRLSVCYTNLGIVYRHKDLYKEAVGYYQEALRLWDRNLTAENNLNILLGRPLKNRNFIQKIFPPDRDQ